MRKILLLAISIFGCYLLTFSQFNKRPQIDSTFKNSSFYNSRKTFGSIDSIHFNWGLNSFANDNNFRFPIQANKNMNYNRGSSRIVEIPKSVGNMPCLKPQGFFPMPISKPDSTVKYSLLIKKTK